MPAPVPPPGPIQPSPDALITEAAAAEAARARTPLQDAPSRPRHLSGPPDDAPFGDTPAGEEMPGEDMPDEDLPDDAFFAPLGDALVRPETAFQFEGPVSRYELTWRQEAFCRHYVACGIGAKAARLAGYSVQSARHVAYENLRNMKVRWRIQALAAARARRQEREARYLLQMLTGALEMAARQGKPATMVRALAHMARLSGADEAAAARSHAARRLLHAAGNTAGASEPPGAYPADAPGAAGDLDAPDDLLPPVAPDLLADAVFPAGGAPPAADGPAPDSPDGGSLNDASLDSDPLDRDCPDHDAPPPLRAAADESPTFPDKTRQGEKAAAFQAPRGRPRVGSGDGPA